MQFIINFAYIDPGTGSLIIQSLIGAVAGIAVFGRRALLSIKMKFRKDKTDAPASIGTTTKKPDDKK